MIRNIRRRNIYILKIIIVTRGRDTSFICSSLDIFHECLYLLVLIIFYEICWM